MFDIITLLGYLCTNHCKQWRTKLCHPLLLGVLDQVLEMLVSLYPNMALYNIRLTTPLTTLFLPLDMTIVALIREFSLNLIPNWHLCTSTYIGLGRGGYVMGT